MQYKKDGQGGFSLALAGQLNHHASRLLRGALDCIPTLKSGVVLILPTEEFFSPDVGTLAGGAFRRGHQTGVTSRVWTREVS
jgi:hypothetical protein